MTVGMDYISSFGTGGNGRYTRELARALIREAPGAQFFLCTYLHHVKPRLRYTEPAPNATFSAVYLPALPGAPLARLGMRISRALLRRELARGRVGIMHFTNPLFFAGELPAGVKIVTTIHDLAVLVHPSWARPASAAYFKMSLARVVESSDALIVPSEHTKRDLLGFFPGIAWKVRVVPEGVSEVFRQRPPEPSREVSDPGGRPYILTVGEIQPRKNLGMLLRAFQELPAEVRGRYLLVHAGDARSLRERKEFQELAERLGLDAALRVLGHVSDERLRELYRGAAVFVFPSLYEGFGLPVLEAMACGAPTLAARGSALPEVGGEAVLYFDPANAVELRDLLLRVLQDEALRSSLQDRGRKQAEHFSWERAARETLALYHSLR